MDKIKIAVATGNTHKLQEIAQILTGFTLVSMRELGFVGDVEENGSTFRENAFIKADTICKKFSMPALADDSGLCVDALNGAPGVYSARYSGSGDAENRRLLLKNLQGEHNRTARFKSVVCLRFPDGRTVYGEGCCEGRILGEEVGDNGFGYDPIFFSDDLQKCFGVASAQEKNGVSHRFRALMQLKEKL